MRRAGPVRLEGIVTFIIVLERGSEEAEEAEVEEFEGLGDLESILVSLFFVDLIMRKPEGFGVDAVGSDNLIVGSVVPSCSCCLLSACGPFFAAAAALALRSLICFLAALDYYLMSIDANRWYC